MAALGGTLALAAPKLDRPVLATLLTLPVCLNTGPCSLHPQTLPGLTLTRPGSAGAGLSSRHKQRPWGTREEKWWLVQGLWSGRGGTCGHGLRIRLEQTSETTDLNQESLSTPARPSSGADVHVSER